MRDDWKRFLIDSGAEFEDDRLRDYGNPERERSVAVNGDIICDLSHRGLLSIRGKDAQGFLQGQFGNDIKAVTPTLTQLSSYASPKGRAYAVLRVLLDREAYLVDVNPSRTEFVRKQLSKYILRSEVVIARAEDSHIRFGTSGPNVETKLREIVGTLPEQPNAIVSWQGAMLVRVPRMVHPRFEIFGDIDTCRRLWSDLNVHGAPVGPEGWQLLDILAAVPTVYEATNEAFVPQMLNLHALDGISFSKGCYPGQEVVARMHYLGKLKRRMYRLAIEGPEEVPVPGSPVYRAGGDSGQPDGEIVDAVLHPDGLWAALAVMQIAATDAPLCWGRPDGPAAHVIPLPYPVPEGA